MNLYSIRKGESKFSGKKPQVIYFQLSSLIIGLILAFCFHSITIGFVALLTFLIFSTLAKASVDEQSMRVYFLPTCSYNLEENSEQINTIYGFANGHKKWNSAYIGWKGIGNGLIEIYSCTYVNGLYAFKPLIRCKVQSWVFLNIENKSKKYTFKVMSHNGKHMITSVRKGNFLSFYTLFNLFTYKLYPSVESKKIAQIDMKIYLKKLALE